MKEVLYTLVIYLVGFFSKVGFDIYLSGYFKYKKEEWDNRFLKCKEGTFNDYKVRWEYKKKDNDYNIYRIELLCPHCNKYSGIVDNTCYKCKKHIDYQNVENQIKNNIKKRYYKIISILPKPQMWML